jgi:hypothetical protein
MQVRGPMEAKCAGQKGDRIAFTPRLSSVRARPGPRISPHQRLTASGRKGVTEALVRSSSTNDVQTVRNVIELVWKQVPIQIESHARRCVPEHLLNELHVGASCDGQRRGRVP